MRRNWNIWDEMRRMQDEMDLVFNNFFRDEPFFSKNNNLIEGPKDKGGLVESNYKQPISDIYENDKEIIAEIEMPGIDKKDIKVHVTEEGIEVKAESKAEVKHEDKKTGMYRFERNYSGYLRHFALPKNVDPDKANAEYKDGVLKITVPKLKVEQQKRKLLDVK